MQGRMDAAGMLVEPEPGAIDLAHLDRATSGDRVLQFELLSLFDRQAKVLLVQIEDASDLPTRHAAAHTLKGAALGVGALAVASAAEEFENAADDPARRDGSFARLAMQIAAARHEIADILGRR